MKISAKKLEAIKSENNKAITRISALIEDKKRIKQVYGYEEQNEKIEDYENMLKSILETKESVDNAVLLECGNYEFN